MKDRELKDERGVMITNKARCKTCIFHHGQKVISRERLGEIQAYLMTGQPHQCHNTPYLCRGGREFQAQVFARMGMITEETVEALEQAIVDNMNQ